MCQSRNGLIETADGTVKAAVDSYYPVEVKGQQYMTTVTTTSCALLVRVLLVKSTGQFSVLCGARTRKKVKAANQLTHAVTPIIGT
jgi:hypothetical protein